MSKTTTLHIQGMYCPHCETRVAGALRALEGVVSVRADYARGEAEIVSRAALDPATADAALRPLGYSVTDPGGELTRSISLLVILLGLAAILDRLGLLSRLVPGQLGESGMSYGLFFLTGLFTSVHCVAMCGGINLSQSLPGRGRWAGVLYNAGRVVSYTLIGAVLGGIGLLFGGGSFTPSPLLQSGVKLLAGAWMLLAGVQMLGIFPAARRLRLSLPRLRKSSRLPFVIGLLNGLMPCGPLQAMQLAALGTGSPIRGGLAMLCFSLGTVPLMLGLGGLVALLGQRFARAVSAAGAVLVAVFGVAMLSQAAALSGMVQSWQLWAVLLALSALGLVTMLPIGKAPRRVLGAGVLAAAVLVFAVDAQPASSAESAARVENGVQIVRSTLTPGQYPAITVQAGLPVRWTIQASEDAINGCNARLIIPDLGLELAFQPGENTLEFTPDAPGTIPYSCWMGMIRSTITVTK